MISNLGYNVSENCTYPGGQSVDTDVVLSPLLSDGTAHLVDGGLGGVVGRAGEAL